MSRNSHRVQPRVCDRDFRPIQGGAKVVQVVMRRQVSGFEQYQQERSKVRAATGTRRRLRSVSHPTARRQRSSCRVPFFSPVHVEVSNCAAGSASAGAACEASSTLVAATILAITRPASAATLVHHGILTLREQSRRCRSSHRNSTYSTWGARRK